MHSQRQVELKQMKCLPMDEVVKIFGVKVVRKGSNVMFKALWRNEKVASVTQSDKLLMGSGYLKIMEQVIKEQT
ncbi:hypothetical protein MHK_001389 [Candidatus Magnetomorum sp. HK-1]|nr:hypothetical protein MHK_001389 [Candidatus Magnetomorum sp. HK-1]